MATKKNNYITEDLDWAEKQLSTWKEFIDNHPYPHLKDRREGGRLVATIEQQMKSLQETLKMYLSLLETVDRLREREEEKKKKIRGDEDTTPMENGEI